MAEGGRETVFGNCRIGEIEKWRRAGIQKQNLHCKQHQRSSAIIKIQENSQCYVYTTVFKESSNKIGSIDFSSIN